jgi:GNAT superfamily N-acetyltransferase
MEFRISTKADIPEIIRLRIRFLKSINATHEDLDEGRLALELENYLKERLNRDFINWFAMEGSYVVGTVGICFHDFPPGFDNLNATREYILNIYTVPQFRKKGIAGKIFEKLLAEAKRRKVDFISLHTTEAGKSLYEKFGFKTKQNEMILSLHSPKMEPVGFKP